MTPLTTIINNRVLLHSLLLLVATTITVQGLSSMDMKTRLPSVSPLSGATLQELVLEASRVETMMAEDNISSPISSTLDLQGILWMKHINLVVGRKELAEYFFLDVLGLTGDAVKSFHMNLGQQQFHLAETKGDDQPPPDRCWHYRISIPKSQCPSGAFGASTRKWMSKGDVL
jgi:hypothetical protein